MDRKVSVADYLACQVVVCSGMLGLGGRFRVGQWNNSLVCWPFCMKDRREGGFNCVRWSEAREGKIGGGFRQRTHPLRLPLFYVQRPRKILMMDNLITRWKI